MYYLLWFEPKYYSDPIKKKRFTCSLETNKLVAKSCWIYPHITWLFKSFQILTAHLTHIHESQISKPVPCVTAVDINSEMSLEYTCQRVFVFFLTTMLTVKIINGTSWELMSMWRTVAQPFNMIYSRTSGPLVLWTWGSFAKMDNGCHPIHPAPTTTTITGAPTYPTLQSPQIRFNQTTCAVWLGVRKRIISKQRSYSPGFIGIRTGLLCRI